jgi:hypothetical protein
MGKSSKSITKTTLQQPDNTTTSGDVNEFKIVKVSPATHKRLLKHGAKSETFDQIINRALDALEELEERRDHT